MGNNLDEQTIERLIQKMSQSINQRSPYEHLHDWLKEANPEVFKQWQSIYDIEKE